VDGKFKANAIVGFAVVVVEPVAPAEGATEGSINGMLVSKLVGTTTDGVNVGAAIEAVLG
jgi:hypothetical protein